SFVDSAYMPEERTKPWGTGHAILCAKDVIKEPFAVINADDFYGQDAFKTAADFLNNGCNGHTYSIIGYQLDKTLSDNGTVSRGVCSVDNSNNLVAINERTKIYNKEGKVIYEDSEGVKEVDGKSNVSMNFWCLILLCLILQESYSAFSLKSIWVISKPNFLFQLLAISL
ncbi:MAG: nucleotidyltransferase, partial [Ferruginibacter sp.]